MEDQNKYPLGLIKDYHDKRDYLLSAIQPERIPLPNKYLLIPEMTSIQQQNYGTCTSHSVDGVKEYLDSKEYGKEIKLSQKFIYHNTKVISNLWDYQGDYLRNAIRSICQYGACKEETFPDERRDSWKEYVTEKPSEDAYKEAEEFKGKTYWSIRVSKAHPEESIYNLKAAYYRNQSPVCIGMKWAKEFTSSNVGDDGKLPLPENFTMGHAISFVGWTLGKLWFRNSWGDNYGKDGYFYVLESEFDKYIWWNAWILLDLPKPKPAIGWVAEDCLTEVGSKFHQEDIVKSIYSTWRVRIRAKPGLDGERIGWLHPGEEAEIIEDGIQGKEHKWWKVRIKE